MSDESERADGRGREVPESAETERIPPSEQQPTSAVVTSRGDTTVIAQTVARVVTPIILIASLSLLFQGHNWPGGGFIGGVLTATAFALVFVIYGLEYVREEIMGITTERALDQAGFVGAFRMVFSIGLALAAGSGLVPILFELPFLTQAVLFVHDLPLYGELELASAFAFDLGVYFVVVGGLLTILARVGQE